MIVRKGFVVAVLRMTKAALRGKFCMSMDGVIISMPPEKEIERFNYCWGGVTHMWRKKGEANLPRLAGANDYDKQVPISRSIPLWGGLSEDGFEPVFWHLDSRGQWVTFGRGHAAKITHRRDESSISPDVNAYSPHNPL